MSKLTIILLALLACATASADTIVYICERPAWEGVDGCGVNNTAFTYGFWVETEDFDHNVDKDRLWYNLPKYRYIEHEGCDLKEAQGNEGRFTVTDDAIEFWLGKAVSNSRKVELDTIAMTAKLTGHTVKHSHDLSCEEVRGDAIELHPTIVGWNRASPTMFWPSSPTRPGY